MATKSEWKKVKGSSFWTPENTNDQLIGVVVTVHAHAEYGKQWDIETSEGEIVRTPSHKVLQNRMDRVKEGDEVKIVFTGTEAPGVKGHKPTQIYDVYTKE